MTLAIEATAPERKKEINVVACRQEWERGEIMCRYLQDIHRKLEGLQYLNVNDFKDYQITGRT